MLKYRLSNNKIINFIMFKFEIKIKFLLVVVMIAARKLRLMQKEGRGGIKHAGIE